MNKGLPRTAPQSLGLDPAALRAFVSALEESHARMHGCLLVKDGQVALEKYWLPRGPADRMWVYSLSKSFTSTAIGIAVGEGLLRLDMPVAELFADKLPVSAGGHLPAMTVENLLTMCTGHGADTLDALLHSADGDWARAFFACPVEHAPGTRFVYNSGASYMLSAILQRAAGCTMMEYLQPRLFDPLGMEDISMDRCPGGVNTGGWGLSVRLEDIAKLGLLYLQSGVYQGQVIVPADYTRAAVSLRVRNGDDPTRTVDWRQGYGYQFWRCRHDCFRGDGAFGQYCIGIPAANAVLAITSETADMQELLDIVWERLLPALRPVAAHPAGSSTGGCYVVEPNALGIRRIVLGLESHALVLRCEDNHGVLHRLVAGLEEPRRGETTLPVLAPSFTGRFALADQPLSVSAVCTWDPPDRIEVSISLLEYPHDSRIEIGLGGNRLRLVATSSFQADGIPMLDRRVVLQGIRRKDGSI